MAPLSRGLSPAPKAGGGAQGKGRRRDAATERRREGRWRASARGRALHAAAGAERADALRARGGGIFALHFLQNMVSYRHGRVLRRGFRLHQAAHRPLEKEVLCQVAGGAGAAFGGRHGRGGVHGRQLLGGARLHAPAGGAGGAAVLSAPEKEETAK